MFSYVSLSVRKLAVHTRGSFFRVKSMKMPQSEANWKVHIPIRWNSIRNPCECSIENTMGQKKFTLKKSINVAPLRSSQHTFVQSYIYYASYISLQSADVNSIQSGTRWVHKFFGAFYKPLGGAIVEQSLYQNPDSAVVILE